MMRAISLACAVSLLASGCMPDVRPESYSVGTVGQVNRSVAAVVVSARPVTINGAKGGGALAGGAVGAIAGSQAGGSDAASAIGAIGGMVVGAIAGAATERRASETSGMEYVVETANGNLMTIVQGASPAFAPGDRVLVLYGSPARLIQDPRR